MANKKRRGLAGSLFSIGSRNKSHKKTKKSTKKKVAKKKEHKEHKNKKNKKGPVKKTLSEQYSSEGLSKLRKDIRSASSKSKKIKSEVRKAVVGQDKVIDDLLVSLFCEGSVLLEGVPGIAKTLIMKSLASSIGCTSKRIQFTADLLPTDITGFMAYSRQKGFFVVKGPVFANFVLADEINRAPPKVQSALMEVMQEKQVTIGKKTYHLERPFLIFATENPLENRGVYKLPEAQVDRFFFKIMVDYPSNEDAQQIMETNVSYKRFEDYNIKPVVSPKEIVKIQELVKKIFVHDKIKKYIADLVESTRPDKKKNEITLVNKYVAWGASPRAAINIYLSARANALLNGRAFVVPQDVKDIAYNVLRHRVILNYQGQIDNIQTENIIDAILKKVKVP